MINIIPIPIGRITIAQFAQANGIDLESAQIILEQLVVNGDITAPVSHTIFNGPIYPLDIDTYLESELSGQVVNLGPPISTDSKFITIVAERNNLINVGVIWSNGNGAAGNIGVAMPFDGVLRTLTLTCGVAPSGGPLTVDMFVNGVSQQPITIPDAGSSQVLQVPLPLLVWEGDLVRFEASVNNGAESGVVTAIIETQE